MTRVYANSSDAAAIGAKARADIESLHSPSARGPLLRRLLDESRLTGTSEVEMSLSPSSMESPATFEAAAMNAESLLGSPRPDLPSRMQRLVTPLRRLVLRCIRTFWVQQRTIDRALLDAMRTLHREIASDAAAQERIREQLAELAEDVRALRENIGTSEADRARARSKQN
jgi:hypothetical protein